MYIIILSLISAWLATSATAACNIAYGKAYGGCADVTEDTGEVVSLARGSDA